MHISSICNLIKTQAPGATSLILSNNKIADESALQLCRALADTQIESLDLSKNKLTDLCAEPIAQTLKTNKNLKHLNLTDNGIASRVSKNKLTNGLKKIEVIV